MWNRRWIAGGLISAVALVAALASGCAAESVTAAERLVAPPTDTPAPAVAETAGAASSGPADATDASTEAQEATQAVPTVDADAADVSLVPQDQSPAIASNGDLPTGRDALAMARDSGQAHILFFWGAH